MMTTGGNGHFISFVLLKGGGNEALCIDFSINQETARNRSHRVR